MMNKKQAIGLVVIVLFFAAIMGLTSESSLNARSRAAEGAFGGAIGGAVIGGAVGGGRGAGVGAAVGLGTGLMIGAAADEQAAAEEAYNYESRPRIRQVYYTDYDNSYDNDDIVMVRKIPKQSGRKRNQTATTKKKKKQIVNVDNEYYSNDYYSL